MWGFWRLLLNYIVRLAGGELWSNIMSHDCLSELISIMVINRGLLKGKLRYIA